MNHNDSTVLIAGAGQLGSRYLQGLANCRLPLRIYVQDPSQQSLDRATQRWDEVRDPGLPHHASFHSSFDLLPPRIDIAIVATTANVRADVVAQIGGRAGARFWILEKVLTQSEADLDRLLSQLMNASGAWVNTPRRMMPWHQQLKSRLAFDTPVTVDVSGGLWGLACNSVHFLDLCAWWTGEELSSVNTARLDPDWFESKRPGFWEVSGTLEACYSGGSRAILTAAKNGVTTSLEVRNGDNSWEIHEDMGVARRCDGFQVAGRLVYQSEMSGPLVETILGTGRCELPSLSEAGVTHRALIRGLHEHWKRAGHPNATSVPVT